MLNPLFCVIETCTCMSDQNWRSASIHLTSIFLDGLIQNDIFLFLTSNLTWNSFRSLLSSIDVFFLQYSLVLLWSFLCVTCHVCLSDAVNLSIVWSGLRQLFVQTCGVISLTRVLLWIQRLLEISVSPLKRVSFDPPSRLNDFYRLKQWDLLNKTWWFHLLRTRKPPRKIFLPLLAEPDCYSSRVALAVEHR